MFKRITIIGLGLIGGSLALAIREKKLAREIIGVSRKKTTINYAVKENIVDFATLDLKRGVENSDFVIITTPVFKIVDIAKNIAPFLKNGCILTDAGSTKAYIEKHMPGSLNFVGSHPIAGSEASGIRSADKDLFKDAFCILTKTKKTKPESIAKIKKLWEKLEMKVLVMSSQAHDRLLSRISHLPHAASACIVNSAGRNGLGLAAGGFRDTTRIASGDPELWRDIFLTNKRNLAKDIEVFRKELLKIETALKTNNSRRLLKLLKNAKSIRDSM